MTHLICLANSWKHQERCIAGIVPTSGEWLRPVTDSGDGSVPEHLRKIGKAEPRLLDILDLPLADDGPGRDFERENRLILPGRWRVIGRLRAAALRRYIEADRPLLHTSTPYVTIEYLRSLPLAQRQTLQLVETVSFTVEATRRNHSGNQVWRGRIVTTDGQALCEYHRSGFRCAAFHWPSSK